MIACLRLTVIFFAIFLISACHHLTPSQTTAPVSCQATCQQHLISCQSSCRDNCPQCLAKTQASAHRAFTRYVHEQKLRGCELSRELNSYFDPLQCRKVTCSCLDDYRRCKASCG